MITSQLKEHLVKIKPDAAKGTIATYGSTLSSFVKKRFGKDVTLPQSLEFISDPADTISFFETAYAESPSSTKKTLLAALYAVNASPIYHANMIKYSSQNTAEIRKQEKSETQQENWIPYEDVLRIVEYHRKDTLKLFRSKVPLDTDELMRAQRYLILALTTGVFIPPRRSTDWIEMSLRNKSETNNYITKDKLVFVTYKTAKTYGTQEIEIPAKMKLLLNKWKILNPNDSLIVNRDGSRMTTSRLTLELNTIFNRKISTSMLRHIYLSHRLGYIPKLSELDALAEQMGHSHSQQMEYIKY